MNATFTTAEITAATEAISSSYPNLGRRKLRVLAHKMLKENKTQALLKKEAKNQAIIDARVAKEAERQAKRDMELEELNDPNPFDINKTYFKQASEDLKIAMMIPNSMF